MIDFNGDFVSWIFIILDNGLPTTLPPVDEKARGLNEPNYHLFMSRQGYMIADGRKTITLSVVD
jgi:hypothetical protein